MAGIISTVQAGTVLGGDFRIEGLLGQGGMGSVYVAEQLSTGRRRALKLMSPILVADEKSRGRFLQEARVGARVDSDHVVEVVSAGVDEATGMPWLAMELLEGEPFADTLSRRGALPRPEVREVFAQLGHALGGAHRVGLVHRDIKPENVFLATPRRTGVPFTVKVLDFGLAKVLEAASLHGSTTEAMGSPLWMAPEQTGKGKVVPATDVWALGLMAFNALTGKPYWKAAHGDEGSINQLLVEIVVEPIELASVRAASIGLQELLPPGFDDWFARCVTREPEARFANAAEAVSALSPLLEGPLDVAAAAAALAAGTTTPTTEGAALAATASSGPADADGMAATAPSGPAEADGMAATAPSGPAEADGMAATAPSGPAETPGWAERAPSGPPPAEPALSGLSGAAGAPPLAAATGEEARGAKRSKGPGLVAAVVVLLLLMVAAALGVGLLLGRGDGQGPHGGAVAEGPGTATPAAVVDGPPPAVAATDGGGAPAPGDGGVTPHGDGALGGDGQGPTTSPRAAGGDQGSTPPAAAAVGSDTPRSSSAPTTRTKRGTGRVRPKRSEVSEENRGAVACLRAVGNTCFRGNPSFLPDSTRYSFRVAIDVGAGGGMRSMELPPEIRGTTMARCLVTQAQRCPFRPTDDGDRLRVGVRVSR